MKNNLICYVVCHLLVLISSCSTGVNGTMNITANGTLTNNITANIPGIQLPDFCRYVPAAYRHYFPDCPGAPALSIPVVSAEYSFAPNWNDYVKADGTGACDGTGTTYTACFNGGERRVAVTEETSCDGLSMVDNLNAFTWTCSMQAGVATFTSQLKPNAGLSTLIGGTSFLPMYVTMNNGSENSVSVSSTWWSNPIVSLPDNSSNTASAITLTTPGVIYVTSANILTSGYIIGDDKVSIATLSGANVSHNGNSHANTAYSGVAGNDLTSVVSSGGHKYVWIEGSFDMNNSGCGGEWTVDMSSSIFSRLNQVTAWRGYAVYVYNSNYNILSSVTAQDSCDFGITLDTSNGNAVLNSMGENNSVHYSLGVGNAGGNYVYNFKSLNSFGGIRIWSSTASNTFDQLYIDTVESGIYLPTDTVTNYISNATIKNVSTTVNGSGVYFDRTDNQSVTNVWVENAPHGVNFNTAHNNVLNNLRFTNDTYGIFTYDGAGTAISGQVWYDNDTTECDNTWGPTPGYNPSTCAAADASSFNVVTFSSNVFGYQL